MQKYEDTADTSEPLLTIHCTITGRLAVTLRNSTEAFNADIILFKIIQNYFFRFQDQPKLCRIWKYRTSAETRAKGIIQKARETVMNILA